MWQPVLTISGYILGILGLIMLIPAGFDIWQGGAVWSPFLAAATASMFFGFSLFLSNNTKFERIGVKQAYLVTTISWLWVCVFAAVPFYLYGVVSSPADAWFEAMSGLTGTGATIISDVEALPQPILLWRSLLNGIGGLGVVIFAVALLPILGIGGMQMFQRENSDSNDKFMPKFSYIAKRIVAVYLTLIGVCCAVYIFCGMGWFDAVNHAISVIGTGGFSTKNNSIESFNSLPIELWTMLFMLCGAVPMTSYILFIRGAPADRNRQIATLLKIVGYCGLALAFYLYFVNESSFFNALRQGYFTVIATVTTTGLTSCDYIKWGGWATSLILLLSLCGGCTGSTSGSIKIFRWQVVFAFLRKSLVSAIETNRVILMKIGSINLSEKVSVSVFVYLFSFFISLTLLTLLVSLNGYDFATSFAAVMACITNVGMGAVESIGPRGNYAFFAPEVKCILTFAMFLGRLEVITVMVVFSKSFWRR
jgi:trk system potassium uptake protein TrkH